MIQEVLGIEGERKLQVEETECAWVGPMKEWKKEAKIFWTSVLRGPPPWASNLILKGKDFEE